MSSLALEFYKCNTFIPIPVINGYQSIVYLNKIPSRSLVKDTKVSITGYCSYNIVYCADAKYLCGVVFNSFPKYTTLLPNSINVIPFRKIQDDYTIMFTLEKLGIMLFTSKSGNTIILKSKIEHPLIIPLSGQYAYGN